MLNTLRMKPTLKILNVYSRPPPAAAKLLSTSTTTQVTPVTTSFGQDSNPSQSTLLAKLLKSTSSDILTQFGANSTTNTTTTGASTDPRLKADTELSNEFYASFKSSTTVWSTLAESDLSDDSSHPHYEYDDTLDILMPLFVGLLVAIILGWMLMRYKMSAHQRSNYNGSIYCCPEECFNFCSRFLDCQFR